MPTDHTHVLQSSSDPDELVLAALSLARGARPDGHAALLKRMQATDFLDKLDSREEYDNLSSKLRVGQALEALQDNRAPSAREVLVALTQSPAFKRSSRRTDLLITACAALRPAPPEVVDFWDAHCQPLDGFTPLTVQAVLDNGSEPALQLFERKMLDPKHEDIEKIEWLRWGVLRHRNDLPLLQCCERLVKGRLAEELRPLLIDVVFAYRRAEWYSLKRDRVPVPPPREEASKDARDLLREIGEYALKKVELSDELKERVETVLEEISQGNP